MGRRSVHVVEGISHQCCFASDHTMHRCIIGGHIDRGSIVSLFKGGKTCSNAGIGGGLGIWLQHLGDVGQVGLEVVHFIHCGVEQGEFQFYSLTNCINLFRNVCGHGINPGAYLHKLVVVSVNVGQGKVEVAKEGIILTFHNSTGLLIFRAHPCKEHVIVA